MKALSPKLTIAAGYIRQLPFPATLANDAELATMAETCLALKTAVLSRKLGNDEYLFKGPPPNVELDAFIEQSILSDLEFETRRLAVERAVEVAVRRHFPKWFLDEDWISREVGQCVVALPAHELRVSIDELDRLLAGTLDTACRYRGGVHRGNRFGCEGSIEALAQHFAVQPDEVFAACRANVAGLTKVKALYRADIFHRATLHVMGFDSNRRLVARRRSLDAVARDVSDLVPNPGSAKLLEEWLRARLAPLNSEAFWHRPTLRVEGTTVELARLTG